MKFFIIKAFFPILQIFTLSQKKFRWLEVDDEWKNEWNWKWMTPAFFPKVFLSPAIDVKNFAGRINMHRNKHQAFKLNKILIGKRVLF